MDREKIRRANDLLSEEASLKSKVDYWKDALEAKATGLDCENSSGARFHVLETIKENWDVFAPVMPDFFCNTLKKNISDAEIRLQTISNQIYEL